MLSPMCSYDCRHLQLTPGHQGYNVNLIGPAFRLRLHAAYTEEPYAKLSILRRQP